MADFNIAYEKTGGFEGGYSNNPADAGGETIFGIARNFNKDWEGWVIVDSIKKNNTNFKSLLESNSELKELAKSLYRKVYWDSLKLNEFEQEISNELYDTSVNQGQGRAGEAMQRALNILNRNQKDYKDIDTDGSIGVNTITAYNALMNTEKTLGRKKDKLVKWIIKWINFFQMQIYYKHYGTGQEVFMPGWTERT